MKLQELLKNVRCPKFLLCLTVASACLAAPGAGQEEIKSFPNFPIGGRYEWTPDIDGDGHWDVVIGDAGYHVGPGFTSEGRVYLLSGQSGGKIYEYIGTFFLGYLGIDVAALGRVDADTTPDFGATGRESFVWSGADGSGLFSDLVGVGSIARLGDLNGDGFDDFARGVAFQRVERPRAADSRPGGSPPLPMVQAHAACLRPPHRLHSAQSIVRAPSR